MSKKSIAIAHRMSSKMCILTKKMTSLSKSKVPLVNDLCWFHKVKKAIDVKLIIVLYNRQGKKKLHDPNKLIGFRKNFFSGDDVSSLIFLPDI